MSEDEGCTCRPANPTVIDSRYPEHHPGCAIETAQESGQARSAERSMTLDEIVQRFDELHPGEVIAVADNFCKYCQSTDLVVNINLEATTGSLAGAQPKVSVRTVAVLECRGCGRVAQS